MTKSNFFEKPKDSTETKNDDIVERFHAARAIKPEEIIQRILKGDEAAIVIAQTPVVELAQFYPPEQALELAKQYNAFLDDLPTLKGNLSPYQQAWLGYFYSLNTDKWDLSKTKQLLESISDKGKPLPLARYFLATVDAKLEDRENPGTIDDYEAFLKDKLQKAADLGCSLAGYDIIYLKVYHILYLRATSSRPVLTEEEKQLFKAAADGNHPIALLHYGWYLKKIKKDEQAIPYLRQAACLGMPKALFELAKLEKKNSPEKYVAYLTAAAETFHHDALVELGNFFLEKDQSIKAAYCFRQAAYSPQKNSVKMTVGDELTSLAETKENNFVIQYLNASFLSAQYSYSDRYKLAELALKNPTLFYSCVLQEPSHWQALDILIRGKAVKGFHEYLKDLAKETMESSVPVSPPLARIIFEYASDLQHLTELYAKLLDKTPTTPELVENFPSVQSQLLEAAESKKDSKAVFQLYLGLQQSDKIASLNWLKQAAFYGEPAAVGIIADLLNHREFPMDRLASPTFLFPSQEAIEEFEKLAERSPPQPGSSLSP